MKPLKLAFSYKHTIYASYLGYITQAVVNNLAPLLFLIFQYEFGLSLVQITLITTLNFAVQLIVDLLMAGTAEKIGYRPLIIAAHIFAAAGLAGLSVFPFIFPQPYAGIILSVVLYAIGGGLTEVLISPIVEACPTDNKAAVMSLLHSFYCWGTVAVVAFSTLLLAAIGKQNWRLLPVLWAILPAANAIFYANVPILQMNENNEGMSFRELISDRLVWVFFILMLAAGASEQAMSQWASAFAEKGLGITKSIGDLAGPCFFSVLMGCSRTFYGKSGDRIDLLKFIRISSVLCIISYLIAVLAPHPAISLLGCGLTGLSVGIMWPGVFSLASAGLPKGGTMMFALLALCGDLGCNSGPTTVGLVSNLFSGNLRAGLTAAIVFPVMMLVFSGFCRKHNLQ